MDDCCFDRHNRMDIEQEGGEESSNVAHNERGYGLEAKKVS